MKAAKDLAAALVGLRDAKAAQAKLLEFNEQMLEAQQAMFAIQQDRAALVERVTELEKRIAQLEAWDAEKQRYHLVEVQAGVTAYALKESAMAAGEPAHQLCASCYHQGQKSILQQETLNPGSVVMRVCHRCGSELIVHGMRENRPPPRRRR